MSKQKIGTLDFCLHPYRGILSEIAREEGVKRQAVHQRMKKGEPRTLERIAEKVRGRREVQRPPGTA